MGGDNAEEDTTSRHHSTSAAPSPPKASKVEALNMAHPAEAQKQRRFQSLLSQERGEGERKGTQRSPNTTTTDYYSRVTFGVPCENARKQERN